MPKAGRSGQVAVAGEGVQHEDGVGALLVERAPRLPGDAHEGEVAATLQVERADSGELTVTGWVTVAPGAGGRGLSEQRPAVRFSDEAERNAVFRSLPIHVLASIAVVWLARELVTSNTAGPAR